MSIHTRPMSRTCTLLLLQRKDKKTGRGDQKVRTYGCNCGRGSAQHGTTLSTATWGTEPAQTTGPKSSHLREKTIFCDYMKRWIFTNYCGNDFMIYVRLHTLNSLSAACKSNLDKTERKKNSLKTCKRHEQMLHKEDRQMAKKHMKGRPSTSLFIRAM